MINELETSMAIIGMLGSIIICAPIALLLFKIKDHYDRNSKKSRKAD